MSNLFLAISIHSLLMSMPMNARPFCSAAIPVVPEPTNGSKTVPPGGQPALMFLLVVAMMEGKEAVILWHPARRMV